MTALTGPVVREEAPLHEEDPVREEDPLREEPPPAAAPAEEHGQAVRAPGSGSTSRSEDSPGQGPKAASATADPYVVDLSAGGSRVVVSHDGGGRLGYVVLDEEGRPLLVESQLDQPVVMEVGRPSGVSDVWLREAEKTAIAVSDISRKLLVKTTSDSQVTAERMASSFTSFRAMLWVTFGVGVGAFTAAVVKGFLSSTSTADVVTTAVFGGLSATAFVAAFISRPSSTMGEAGLRAAWAQTIVTTYWSKLAYMSDPDKVLEQLEQSQRDVNRSMHEYFQAATAPVDAGASGQGREAPPAARSDASSKGGASSTDAIPVPAGGRPS